MIATIASHGYGIGLYYYVLVLVCMVACTLRMAPIWNLTAGLRMSHTWSLLGGLDGTLVMSGLKAWSTLCIAQWLYMADIPGHLRAGPYPLIVGSRPIVPCIDDWACAGVIVTLLAILSQELLIIWLLDRFISRLRKDFSSIVVQYNGLTEAAA